MRTDTPKTIFLKDYTPPAYWVSHVDLDFQIHDGRTVVSAKTQFKKNTGGDLFLYGEDLKLISLKLNGADVKADITSSGLTIKAPLPDEFTLECINEISPKKIHVWKDFIARAAITARSVRPKAFAVLHTIKTVPM